MRFIVPSDILCNGLNIVAKAAATRGIQPVLSNILVEALDSNELRLCATDLDISIEMKIPATVSNAGSITLPAKKLMDIVSKLPNKQVCFSLNPDNNITRITCELSKFELIGISSGEFPSISYPDADEAFSIELEPLLKAIKQTVFAAATYDMNNILSGVFFQVKDTTLEMAATDGNRLARVLKKINAEKSKDYSAIIPSRTLTEFLRITSGVSSESVTIAIKNGQISFNIQDRVLTSRLLEGQYPKYQQLIPNNYEINSEIDRDALISALDLTATMVNDRTSIIKFVFMDNSLQLSADTPDLGDSFDQIDVKYKGEELKIAFNYKYIIDVLRVMESESVKIELGGPLSSVLFKNPDDDDSLFLIMPVQIK